MSYLWVHGVESECDSCLSAINTHLGLPNAAATKWADATKADGQDLWFYPDGSYPKQVEGEWGLTPISGGLSGVTTVELDDPEDLQAVIDEATTGKAVRIPRAKAVEFGFWPEVVV